MQNVGPTYKATVSSAQARDIPITYDNLAALLLSAKIRIRTQIQVENHVTTALFAPKQNRGRKRKGRNYRNGGQSSGSGVKTKFTNSNQNLSGSHSSVSSTNGQSNRPKCQICKGFSHKVQIVTIGSIPHMKDESRLKNSKLWQPPPHGILTPTPPITLHPN